MKLSILAALLAVMVIASACVPIAPDAKCSCTATHRYTC